MGGDWGEQALRPRLGERGKGMLAKRMFDWGRLVCETLSGFGRGIYGSRQLCGYAGNMTVREQKGGSCAYAQQFFSIMSGLGRNERDRLEIDADMQKWWRLTAFSA